MRTKLVPIGNSRGIRLPRAIIQQCGLAEEVELEVHSDHLVIRPAVGVRAGWDEAFARMREAGDDDLLDEPEVSRPTEWEQREWKW